MYLNGISYEIPRYFNIFIMKSNADKHTCGRRESTGDINEYTEDGSYGRFGMRYSQIIYR